MFTPCNNLISAKAMKKGQQGWICAVRSMKQMLEAGLNSEYSFLQVEKKKRPTFTEVCTYYLYSLPCCFIWPWLANVALILIIFPIFHLIPLPCLWLQVTPLRGFPAKLLWREITSFTYIIRSETGYPGCTQTPILWDSIQHPQCLYTPQIPPWVSTVCSDQIARPV